MNVPHNREEYWRLEAAFRGLATNPQFQLILRWIKAERDKRDAENRIIGSENRTSESQALTRILEVNSAALKRDD